MDKPELFVVRTGTYSDEGRRYAYRNTLARSRPEAVRQLERMGRARDEHRAEVRNFLEGRDPEANGGVLFVAGECLPDVPAPVGLIFKVEE